MEMDIYNISQDIHANAVSHGFWDGTEEGVTSDQLCKKLLLIVSEVTEAMEADRKDKYCTLGKINLEILSGSMKTDVFERHVKDTFEDELADAAIRLFDLAYKKGVDLTTHIKLKHAYNRTRPYMHGKSY